MNIPFTAKGGTAPGKIGSCPPFSVEKFRGFAYKGGGFPAESGRIPDNGNGASMKQGMSDGDTNRK